MLPFVVIFVLAGLGLTYAGHKFEGAARRSAGWPTVTGQLELCEVVESRGSSVSEPDTTYDLKLRYSYVVRGITYHGTRFAFGYGGGSDDEPHRRNAEALKRAPHVTVHYDPRHPAESVLSTAVQTNITKLGYSLLVVAAISILFGMLKGW